MKDIELLKIEKQEQNKWDKFVKAEKQHYVQFMLERFLKGMVSCEDLIQTVGNLGNGNVDEHLK